MASRPNLMRARSLPSQQVRGFAFLNPNELSSEDDRFSDSSEPLEDSDGAPNKERSGYEDDEEGGEDGDGDGAGGDMSPVASLLKLPSFFTSHNLLLVNAQNEAERQATQHQQQKYEAVMKRFQVRRVAVRAFSTSNVTAGRSPLNSGHSSITQGRRETDPVVVARRADALERGELPPSQQQNANASAGTSNPQQAPSPERGASFRSISGRTSRHSLPGPGTKRAKSKGYAHSYPPEPQRSTRFTLHRFLMKKKRRMLRRLRRFATNLSSVTYPMSTFQRVREGVLFNLFMVQLVCLPLLPIYFPQERELIMALQIVAEWIYFVDCVLGFNTAYFKNTTNELVTARREIARHYACCGWFWLDLLLSVPVNTVMYLVSDGKGLFELSTLAYLIFDNIARIPWFVSFFRMIQALRAAARALRAGQNFWT